MLATIMTPTSSEENSGTVPDPPRSTQARVKRAYMNVAAKMPSEWNSVRSRANHSTSRGE